MGVIPCTPVTLVEIYEPVILCTPILSVETSVHMLMKYYVHVTSVHVLTLSYVQVLLQESLPVLMRVCVFVNGIPQASVHVTPLESMIAVAVICVCL